MTDGKPLLPGRAIRVAALGGSLGDGELLSRFVAERDGAAFEALVRRHGPMVLAVCRRVAGHEQEAEDAFQATFLVLARRAAVIDPPGQVGNWLYGVAHRTAQKARALAARRRNQERSAAEARASMHTAHAPADDTGVLLHREIARLPALYRAPIVLCDLEGRPRAEVAAEFGIPEGTLSSRLTAGRKRLAAALSRPGVVSAAALASLLSHLGSVEAGVPTPLVTSAVRTAEAVAGGGAVAGAVAPHVIEIASRAVSPLAAARLAVAGFVLAGVTAAGAAVALARGGPDTAAPAAPRVAAGPQPDAGPPAAPSRGGQPRDERPGVRRQIEQGRWVLSAVDPDHRTVAVAEERRLPGRAGDAALQVTEPAGLAVEGLTIDTDAHIEVDGRPGGIEALRPGQRVTLTLRPGQLRIAALTAVTPGPAADAAYEVTAVDARRREVSIRDPATGTVMADLPLSPDVKVELRALGRPSEAGGGLRTASREGTVADLKPGARAALTLAVGGGGEVVIRRVVIPE